ncbi:MAG: aldose epimerase family protein [Phycisphaeraceae bacterium]
MFNRIAHLFAFTSLTVIAMAATGCQGMNHMTQIDAETFGEKDHQPVELYTLRNDNGMVARITNYGATVTELHVPDRNGQLDDVVLGFDNLEQYMQESPYFGCIAGRVANRIAGGTFVLDNTRYSLATNDGPNHLHGGERGFDKVIWRAEPVQRTAGPAIRMTYRSHNGEEGYPGNLDAEVVYILTNDNELVVEMSATTDAPTPVNLAHHTYWNLAGQAHPDVLDHELMLNAGHYTPVDETMIPTGEQKPVVGSAFDFREIKPIGRDIHNLPASGDGPGGYDHNFMLRDANMVHELVADQPLRLAARVYEPNSGRVMEILTDQPGIQFYSGNFLDGTLTGKNGAVYGKHAGFCLETQGIPNAVNEPNFPSIILQPGETYQHRMVHRFTAH